MFFRKKEAIENKLSKKPRVDYEGAAEVFRRVNIFLSLVSLTLLSCATYVFLTEVYVSREAYFVQSTGEFKKIEYSPETNEKIKKRWNER